MSSMKELARLMKELEDQLVACMRCGLCQAVCPLFAETGREADVAPVSYTHLTLPTIYSV